jgi:nitroreductase
MHTQTSSPVHSSEELALHPVLAHRRSTIAFSSRPVEKEKLHTILEAGRWSPSSYNEQPWRFIITTQDEPEKFAAVLGSLVESNRAWAKNAYALLAIITKTESNITHLPNPYAWHDAGAALGHMMVQATALGVFTHAMGGFTTATAKRVMNIPQGYEPVTMMALGYAGDASDLPTALQEREKAPRKRLALKEIVFNGTWGEAI